MKSCERFYSQHVNDLKQPEARVFIVEEKHENSTEGPSFIARSGYFTDLKNCLTFLYIELSWQAAGTDGDMKTFLHYKNKTNKTLTVDEIHL